MSKLLESTKIADEIKDVFEFDEYSAFSDFDIEEEKHYEGEWKVSFKLLDVPMEISVRIKNRDEKDLALLTDPDYGTPELEYHVYDGQWEDFRSFDYTAKKPILFLLFEVCGRIRKMKK